MVNYQNGKVYKIINENNEIIYIGSTAEEKLCKRYAKHYLKAPNNKIILIENYPCNSKEELLMREQQIIEDHSNLLNKIRAYISEEDKNIKLSWLLNNLEKFSVNGFNIKYECIHKGWDIVHLYAIKENK
mgnify:CR=1 FL=1